jgi:hypothetical protein
MVTGEGFRFNPARIEWVSDQPLRLLIWNHGREGHVFHSPELFGPEAGVLWHQPKVALQEANAVVLQPGQSIELSFTASAGLYPFRCWECWIIKIFKGKFAQDEITHQRLRVGSKKSVQQGRSRFYARSVRWVHEHGKMARTPLAAFFNRPLLDKRLDKRAHGHEGHDPRQRSFFKIMNVLSGKSQKGRQATATLWIFYWLRSEVQEPQRSGGLHLSREGWKGQWRRLTECLLVSVSHQQAMFYLPGTASMEVLDLASRSQLVEASIFWPAVASLGIRERQSSSVSPCVPVETRVGPVVTALASAFDDGEAGEAAEPLAPVAPPFISAQPMVKVARPKEA